RLTQALALEPENTKIVSNLGILALKQGRENEAKAFFETVLELEPEDKIAKRYLDELT
ncbi:MAG: tetratricopeptide repeat protein, partial [Alkalispirochaetaceae bacterium]